MKVKYTQLAIINLLLGVVAICLYLPYTLEAFNMAGFEWFKFVPKMLKDNYFNVLVYYGIFLLAWFIVINLISLLSHPTKAKILYKLTVVVALALPLIYVLTLKNDTALKFWINNISKNIKMISYVLLIVSWGSWLLATLKHITKRNQANGHHMLQGLIMCILLTLLIAVNGWCGWDVGKMYVKLYGIMVGIFAIYLPISTMSLILNRNKRT